MTAQDYPVKHPYGATYSPWSPTSPHRGNDRACPSGTPVVINGTTIGLTGTTGLSTGPHLHTQAGTDLACQNTFNPTPLEFKPGKVVNLRTTDSGAWGKFVTVQVGTQYITYAHLSAVNVTIGQIIGESMSTTDLGQERILAYHIAGRNGYDGRPNAINGETDKDLQGHVGQDSAKEIWTWFNSAEGRNYRDVILPKVYAERDAAKKSLSEVTTDRNGLMVKLDTANKQIADLTAQNTELTNKNNELQATITAQEAEIKRLTNELSNRPTTPTDEAEVVKSWFARLIDKLTFWSKT